MTQIEAFGWTLALELPVLFAAGWYWKVNPRRTLLAGLLANGLSHPIAWTVAINLSAASYRWAWYVIELVVVLAEAIILGALMRRSVRQSLVLSLLANMVSALAGRFVQ